METAGTYPAEKLRVVDEAQLDELLAGDLPVLVELQSPWCSSCRRMARAIGAAADALAGEVQVVLVDIDETPRLSRRFDIPGVPTTVLLTEGQEVLRIIGARTPTQLLEAVRGGLLLSPGEATSDGGRADAAG